jgi:hypothetical protein
MRISGASHDNQRKRIHVLLPEMRPTISKKEDQVEARKKTRKAKENLSTNPARSTDVLLLWFSNLESREL